MKRPGVVTEDRTPTTTDPAFTYSVETYTIERRVPVPVTNRSYTKNRTQFLVCKIGSEDEKNTVFSW